MDVEPERHIFFYIWRYKIMKGIHKLGTVATKIVEVLYWICIAVVVVAIALVIIAPEGINGLVYGIYIEGSETPLPIEDGKINIPFILLAGLGAVLISTANALVFRNLHLIFKRSANTTPFQKENVRLMRQIGLFTISVPIIQLIMSILLRVVTGVEDVEINLDLTNIVMGIIVLCLTQFFAHGVELENDVDGLV